MQLELLYTRANLVGRHFIPLALMVIYIGVPVAAVIFIRLYLIPGFPITMAYFDLAALHLAAAFVGLTNLRVAESMSEESLATLRYLQAGPRSGQPTGSRARKSLKPYTCKSRRLARRPLFMRIWFFAPVESGMAFEFLQSILDNIFTGIMMIDVSVPSQLLGINIR